jgi:hypothetical protein
VFDKRVFFSVIAAMLALGVAGALIGRIGRVST